MCLMALKVMQIDTPTLGDRTYLVHDGKSAVIVDPQRDIDRILHMLESENVTLSGVLETHIHNDYVSGGLEISKMFGIPYFLSSEDSVAFKHKSVENQELIYIGSFAIKALKTPGHTFNHISYELLDPESKTVGVFSGGSMLHGSTGRPDLLGWDNAEELAGLQHDSARFLAEYLGDNVALYPSHGFGSFCSATPTTTDSSTIGDERKTNAVLLVDKDSYVKSTLFELDVFPKYFKYMGPINREGSKPVDLSMLDQVTVKDLELAVKSGDWVVDLRERQAWALSHLRGSHSIGIEGSFASYLGWLFPYEKSLYLISDSAGDLRKAQRELVRIGIDRISGVFKGPITKFQSTRSLRTATFSELPYAMKAADITILDVRQANERGKSYIKSSKFIPFYEIESRLSELSESAEIWVHCASGYRASAVIGIIENSGRKTVLIDDDYSSAASIKGLTLLGSMISL